MLMSAEWPGVYARAVAEVWGGVALFVNGSEGNQGPGNPTETSEWERVEGMGESLAENVLQLLPDIEMWSLTYTNANLYEVALEEVPRSDWNVPYRSRVQIPYSPKSILKSEGNTPAWKSKSVQFQGQTGT